MTPIRTVKPRRPKVASTLAEKKRSAMAVTTTVDDMGLELETA
jgi:hypothetical protein